MKQFPDIYTKRAHHASWSVIQAATLLAEAKDRECGSLLRYAALELKLAMEQLVFTLILVAKGEADEATLHDCQQQDGLFRVLGEVTPQYERKCRFAEILSAFNPAVPQGAAWNVALIRRHYAALSELCHAQLVIRGMGPAPEQWDESTSLLEEIYDFLAEGLQKDTAVLSFKGATPQAMELWEKYSRGEISLEVVKERFALMKPPLAIPPITATSGKKVRGANPKPAAQ